jgi:GTPase SAR1 family protein
MEKNIIFESNKKILILGGKKVGKTSLITKMKNLQFTNKYNPSECNIYLINSYSNYII